MILVVFHTAGIKKKKDIYHEKKKNFDAVGLKSYCSRLWSRALGAGRWALGGTARACWACWACWARAAGERERARADAQARRGARSAGGHGVGVRGRTSRA